MRLKQGSRYAVVAPTSMGVRITPKDRQPVQTSHDYVMYATSAESNVLNVAASLGLKTKVLTNFVKDNPIASFIQSELRARNIEFVTNDRAGEVGRLLSVKDFDLDRLFGQEGVQILHLSGLIAALSPETSEFCLILARTAKKYGTAVSFDLNFRASFWKNREQELRAAFSEIASLSDILVGNEEDFQLALGVHGPEAGGEALISKIDGFKGMIQRVKTAYPNTEIFATTLRQVLSANSHMWGAILLAGNEWYVEAPREIPVLDRIGGGDSYVGGMLYGILKGWEPEKWLQFGWATGALAATMLHDYCTPANEEQVWSVYAGNARVKR